MLAREMRFWIRNQIGATIPFSAADNDFEINAVMWKRFRGKIFRSPVVSLFDSPTADLADNASVAAASTVLNNTDYEGLHASAELTTTATAGADTKLEIYYEFKIGDVWPSDSPEFDVTNLTKLAEVVTTAGGESRPAQFTL
jgi:hypothetical protein